MRFLPKKPLGTAGNANAALKNPSPTVNGAGTLGLVTHADALRQLPSMNPLTQIQLDHMVCSVPTCEHKDHEAFFFHGRCHPKRGLEVKYQKDTGTMIVACLECSALIVEVLVAHDDQ